MHANPSVKNTTPRPDPNRRTSAGTMPPLLACLAAMLIATVSATGCSSKKDELVESTGRYHLAHDQSGLPRSMTEEEREAEAKRKKKEREEAEEQGIVPDYAPSVRLPISVLIVESPTPPRELIAGEKPVPLTLRQHEYLADSLKRTLLSHPWVEQVMIEPPGAVAGTAYDRTRLARNRGLPAVALISVLGIEREGRFDVTTDLVTFGADGMSPLFASVGGASAAGQMPGGGVPDDVLAAAMEQALLDFDFQMVELHIDLRKQALEGVRARQAAEQARKDGD